MEGKTKRALLIAAELIHEIHNGNDILECFRRAERRLGVISSTRVPQTNDVRTVSLTDFFRKIREFLPKKSQKKEAFAKFVTGHNADVFVRTGGRWLSWGMFAASAVHVKGCKGWYHYWGGFRFPRNRKDDLCFTSESDESLGDIRDYACNITDPKEKENTLANIEFLSKWPESDNTDILILSNGKRIDIRMDAIEDGVTDDGENDPGKTPSLLWSPSYVASSLKRSDAATPAAETEVDPDETESEGEENLSKKRRTTADDLDDAKRQKISRVTHDLLYGGHVDVGSIVVTLDKPHDAVYQLARVIETYPDSKTAKVHYYGTTCRSLNEETKFSLVHVEEGTDRVVLHKPRPSEKVSAYTGEILLDPDVLIGVDIGMKYGVLDASSLSYLKDMAPERRHHVYGGGE